MAWTKNLLFHVIRCSVTVGYVEGNDGVRADSKIKSEQELHEIVAGLKSAGTKVVWTNGCFDILHEGHVSCLERARELGDALVVGVNSDSSVRSIKGPGRPVNPERERARAVSALACVDYAVIFDDLTTVRLLKLLEPDVYAKGGDYTIDTINQEERAVVESYGGRIEILPEVKGVSTTRIVQQRRGTPDRSAAEKNG
jgi:rfaE bifunctional protein nucleotidyltransferase chain/domain